MDVMLALGRRAGFDRAVESYFGGLYRYAYWLCRNRWQAEDIVQESLLRAWRAWPALREDRALLPSVSGGGLTAGRTQDYAIELKRGNYVYSCPLNPTPEYRLVVR